MRSIDLIGCYIFAYLSTVFVGAQSLNQLTSNKDIRILLNRLRRQAAMGAASPAASGGMGQMWMDPPDGLPFYMMSSYMRGGAYPQTMGMPYPGMRYHDGIPGRLADGSDAAQQMYRNTGPGGRRRTRRPAALRTINALQGGPPNRQQRPPPQPSPSQYMPPTGRLPPPPPSPRSPPPSPRGSAPAQGIYYMAPDLIRAGLPAMLSPAKARIVGPMIKQMRAMRRTPDQISDQIGDVLMV